MGTVAQERDDARARADTVTSERNADRVSAAITAALGKSGIIAQNNDDAATILRGVLEVTDKGEVRTKAAPNIVPGQTAEQFIASQLRNMRPHYWPKSLGGGARSGGSMPTGPDISCFKPGGTLTAQMALIDRVGEKAVIEGLRRAGITPPSYLTGGRKGLR